MKYLLAYGQGRMPDEGQGEEMDEKAWAACDSPEEMLELLRSTDKLSPRKARLFACAAVRRVWHLLTGEGLAALGAAERYADVGLSEDARMRLRRKVLEARRDAGAAGPMAAAEALDGVRFSLEVVQAWGGAAVALAATVARAAVIATGEREREDALAAGADVSEAEFRSRMPVQQERCSQCQLLRDIIGLLPFRPLSPLPASVRAWNDGLIVKLATSIYGQRKLPEGASRFCHLDLPRECTLLTGCPPFVGKSTYYDVIDVPATIPLPRE